MAEQIEHIIQYPTTRLHDTPIFLQHGAWHGAFCWRNVQPYLATLGYEVHAISLPGHGNSSHEKGSINQYRIKDYVDCLGDEIDKLPRPPALVGHSLGGLLCMKYLESHPLPGAVLLASVPHTGIARFLLRIFRMAPANMLKHLLLGDLRIEPAELVRKAFLGKDTPVDLDELQHQLAAESMRVSIELMLGVHLHAEQIETPTMVIAGENDAAFSVEEELNLAHLLGSQFLLMAGTAHDLMLEPSWKNIADAIDKFLSIDLKLP